MTYLIKLRIKDSDIRGNKSYKDDTTKLKVYEENTRNKLWIENGSFEKEPINFDHIKGHPINKKVPKKSKLCCWYCTRPLYCRSIQLPYKKEIVENNQVIYHFKGCFCSFECAYTWNHLEGNWNQKTLLYEIYYSIGGKGIIKMAPKKELLLKFGGNLTNDEYEKLLNSKKIVSQIKELPSISINPIIDFQLIDIKKSSILRKHEKYVVYRKKPLFNSINSFFTRN